MDERINTDISDSPIVWSWLVEVATLLFNRDSVRKTSNMVGYAFGERLVFRRARLFEAGQDGFALNVGIFVVASPEEAWKWRSLTRHPEGERWRWSTQEEKVNIDQKRDFGHDIPLKARESVEAILRRVYNTRETLDKDGGVRGIAREFVKMRNWIRTKSYPRCRLSRQVVLRSVRCMQERRDVQNRMLETCGRKTMHQRDLERSGIVIHMNIGEGSMFIGCIVEELDLERILVVFQGIEDNCDDHKAKAKTLTDIEDWTACPLL